ncbi:mannonate dehydratase [Pacificibacter marinus]|uniref:mannonate dehydratase n=1 Tax=Pacificibacter marinus TaxID=658057 RepID=UPI001C074312|nr:mannonate dehydratase [Pacificibacter marinus]MBU2865417.1 mannonate dehydratase [Pacificibacter marinus]
MIESWRWYGPLDKIELGEIAQTGALGIVNALHEIPYGEVWTREAIAARQTMIADAGHGQKWHVVESLPIHERIKRGEGDLTELFASYRQSMANLAAEGLTTICYNFMPLIDWTRTRLDHPLKHGGTSLRFEQRQICALEMFMLERDGAENDFSPEIIAQAKQWYDHATEDDQTKLVAAIMAGLPGAYERYDVASMKEALKLYDGIGRDDIRRNYARFLAEVIPAAQDLGMRFAVHPDDPPRDIFGLPRVMSNAEDIAWVFAQQDVVENGLTLCSGSLGANPANDVPAIARKFSDRIHFAHLRNVAKDPDGSFEEAAHLEGDTDMVELVSVLLGEEQARKAAGREDWELVWRPDHGHELLHDIGSGTHPGYPLLGRMRGLAEMRGVIKALSHQNVKFN